MQIIQAKEIAIVLETLNNVLNALEYKEQSDRFVNKPSHFIFLKQEDYQNLKSAIKKLSD
jgi:hypothetical protein